MSLLALSAIIETSVRVQI